MPPITTDSLGDIRAEIDRVGSDPGLTATVKASRLRQIRQQLANLVGECDRRLGDQTKLRMAESARAAEEVLRMRAAADTRERLLKQGFEPAKLDAQGFLSHEELDRLSEEGLLQEAALQRLRPQD